VDLILAMSPNVGQGTSMAMEDVYLLYRLFQQDMDLQTVFHTFEKIRRPRVTEIWKLSREAGDMRKDTGAWGQWFKEWMMWAWLKFMPESWLSSPFEYDITTVEI
jgi:2-polyprenyl-6-methoxyphenol hydroxylase-like FAD-dependent oxidoreductase